MENVFNPNSHRETQTTYHADGVIVTTPCSFELANDDITPDGDAVSLVGRMNVNNHGHSTFRPFRQGTGSRYTPLYDTEHAEVKASKTAIIMTFRFKKKNQKSQIINALHTESAQIQNWMKSLRTKTVWKQ